MTFVIVRSRDHVYVTNPGSEASFTRDIRKARKWGRREDAERELCPENESIRDINEELGIRA